MAGCRCFPIGDSRSVVWRFCGSDHCGDPWIIAWSLTSGATPAAQQHDLRVLGALDGDIVLATGAAVDADVGIASENSHGLSFRIEGLLAQ